MELPLSFHLVHTQITITETLVVLPLAFPLLHSMPAHTALSSALLHARTLDV